MKRSSIDSLVTEKALAIVNGHDNSRVIDLISSDLPEVKNVCAKLSVKLSDDIDKVCDFLDISKRVFIEAALVDALSKANKIIEDEGARL
jgi:hypothetical protein